MVNEGIILNNSQVAALEKKKYDDKPGIDIMVDCHNHKQPLFGSRIAVKHAEDEQPVREALGYLVSMKHPLINRLLEVTAYLIVFKRLAVQK